MQNNANQKRVARWMKLLCGSLFTIFSFSYLYFLQAELIGRAQHILSAGTTTYAPLFGSVVLTVVAVLLAVGVGKLLKLPVRFMALAFFPSMGLLGWLTDITPVMTDAGLSLGLSNYWFFIILLVLWGGFVFVVRQFPDVKTQYIPFWSAFWTNTFILCCLVLSVAFLGNTEENLHDRLRAERFLSESDYSRLLEVNRKATHVSKQLTAMRALALAHKGELGEALFTFPQDYASSGLIVADADLLDYDTLQTYFHKYWRAVPVGRVQTDAPEFFSRLLERHGADTLAIRDYYLCALLLDCDLEQFVCRLPDFYSLNDSLPLHYREALVLHRQLSAGAMPDEAAVYADTLQEKRLSDFKNYVEKYPHSMERQNYARRQYGHTYWYYYLYGEHDCAKCRNVPF